MLSDYLDSCAVNSEENEPENENLDVIEMDKQVVGQGVYEESDHN